MNKRLPISTLAALAAMLSTPTRPVAQTPYIPQAQLCANGSGMLCPVLAAYIGPDRRLKVGAGYDGLYGPPPNQASGDLQTPFDNMAWQMFVALNWVVDAGDQPPGSGLTAPGRRVWQSYRKVSELFGDSPVLAPCNNPQALPVFNIGSDGNGKPMPNNEEYFQASTNLPLIDINGNWTIYERRVNDIEASYLLSPNGQAAQTLTTMAGQSAFMAANPGGVQFTASATVPTGGNGSIEIKAAWRIINRAAGDDPSRYYTQNALLAVAGDLVRGGRPFCSPVTLGLVGMHILQRNPVDPNNPELLPQWIWATFEHTDNAPPAQAPCNVRNGCVFPNSNWINQPSCGSAVPSKSTRYSFFKQDSTISGTNIAPLALLQAENEKAKPEFRFRTQYPWNPQQPYARGSTSAATAMPQATRCWEIYSTTAALNTQWQAALAKHNSVFRYYTLVGTQWGGTVETPTPPNPVPPQAVPGMLSNITLETYIQNYTGTDANLPGPGSCVGCHKFATLPADNKTSANFSFLPFLAQPDTARSKIKKAE